MPYISSRVNTTITPEQERVLKERLGKAIEIVGKTESWLMLDFEDNCRMYFRGDNSTGMAYVEVKIYGSENKTGFNKMTSEICNIFNDVLGIDPDKIYVKYEAVSNWGWNGGNF